MLIFYHPIPSQNYGIEEISHWGLGIFEHFCFSFTSCYLRTAMKDHNLISSVPESAGISLMFLMSCSLMDRITFPMKAQRLSFSATLHSPLHEQTILPAILPTVKNSCLYHTERQQPQFLSSCFPLSCWCFQICLTIKIKFPRNLKKKFLLVHSKHLARNATIIWIVFWVYVALKWILCSIQKLQHD